MNKMNKIIIAAFALIAVNLPCFSNTPVQAERSESLFDLFYGMTTDSLNSYCDPVLDKIPGLIHEEFSSEWYYPTDSLKSLVSVGIYIDREFPSEKVRKTILSKASTEIANSFVCIAFEWPQSEQVTKGYPQTFQPKIS